MKREALSMMTLEEIQKAKINPSVAREAYEQVSARLNDLLDTKKTFEQKAFTLLSGYLTVSLALFGVAGALYRDEELAALMCPFAVAGGLLVLGAICFVVALKETQYGALASAPDMWLNSGTIDGDDSTVPLMLAYITYFHDNRISVSTRSNARKANWISCGIYIGIAAPFVLIALLLLG